MRTSVSFAAAGGNKKQYQHQIDPISSSRSLELSLARFNLPTIASATSPRNNNNNNATNNTAAGTARTTKPSEATSSHVTIPDDVEQFQKLTPRQRIQLEFKLQHKSSDKQPPSHLFGSTFEKEAAKRTETESREGFRNDKMKKKLERQEQRQSMRLSRSSLALSMSLAIEKGLEEKSKDPKLARPSPWVKNEYGADRHKFQVNWPDRTGAPLPTIPQKWSAPGPGAYSLDTTFGKFDQKLVKETLRETLAEETRRKEKKGKQ